MPNKISFLVPEELDEIMNRVPDAPPGPIDDEIRSIYVLGILCSAFDAITGNIEFSRRLIDVNREELKLGNEVL